MNGLTSSVNVNEVASWVRDLILLRVTESVAELRPEVIKATLLWSLDSVIDWTTVAHLLINDALERGLSRDVGDELSGTFCGHLSLNEENEP